MPRKETKRTSSPLQIESTIQSSGLVQVARPSAAPLPKSSYRPAVSPDMMAATDALGRLSGIFQNMAASQVQEVAENDYRSGQRMRLEAGQEDLDNIDTLLLGASDSRRKGFMYQHGKSNAIQAGAELKQLYERDKGTLVSPGRLNKWLSGHMAGILEGAEQDGEYLQGFLQSFSGIEEHLRGKNAEDNFMTTRAQTRDDYNTALRGDLQQIAKDGTVADIHDTARTYRDHAKVMGLSNDFVNEILFENYRQLAEDAGRADLFGVGTDGAGIFELQGTDVDNPDQTIPGMANSPKWTKRISDEKLRLEGMAARGSAGQDQWAKFQYTQSVKDASAGQNWDKGIQMAARGVQNKTYTASEAQTLINNIEKQRDAYMGNLRRETAIEGNLVHMSLAAGETMADVQQTYDAMWMNKWSAAENDPVKMEEVIQWGISKGSEGGLKPAGLTNLFNAASPENPEKFIQAVNIYGTAKRVDATYAASLLGDTAYKRIAMYEAMLEMGDAPIDAITAMAELNTPEAIQASNELFGRQRFEHEENIRGLINGSQNSWYESDLDAEDSDYLMRNVTNNAKVIMAASGGRISAQRAVDKAKDRFLATHTAVEMAKDITDSDGEQERRTMFIHNNGIPLPPDFTAAQESFAKQTRKALAGTRYESDQGYFLTPDRSDVNKQRYVVHTGHNRYPIPAASGKGPMTVTIGDLMDDYRGRDVVSATELKAQFKATIPAKLEKQETARKGKRKRAVARKMGPSAL